MRDEITSFENRCSLGRVNRGAGGTLDDSHHMIPLIIFEKEILGGGHVIAAEVRESDYRQR